MGSIQLGIQHTVGSLASKPKRDLLMMDFWEIESITFPPEGSSLTPAHHYSEFRYKIYAPIAFRYFRDLFGIQPDDFMMSMCSAPLRELSNPGASGSIFYLTNDDEFIIKTVQHKEGEFLQKLLPGYYMNLNQNPRTLLPKFFGLYCLQTSNSKNIRLVVMNNLLPSYVKMHLKYDLKGSTFKRKASKSERAKKSPTYKDLDFLDHHPNGIFLEAETYNALIKTIQRDCTVLESFKIMDYSLLVGIHNLDLNSREKECEKSKPKSAQSEEIDVDEGLETENCSGIDREHCIASGFNQSSGIYKSILNRQRLVAHSTAMESIQAESEPIDDEEDVPPGGIPARSEKGERLLVFVGIIDILQSYRLKKKLEHTFKSIIHDGDTVSVCRPSFYAQRFQNFMAKTVFRKIPSLDLPEIKGNHRKFRTLVSSYIALKHSPSKRKSLSKSLQRSIDNDQETRSAHTNVHNIVKINQQNKITSNQASAESVTTTHTSAPAVQSKQRLLAINIKKTKVPPPVPPRNSPRRKNLDEQSAPLRSQPTAESHSKPRFGYQRSPSNVRDWLELHDYFELGGSNTIKPFLMSNNSGYLKQSDSLYSSTSFLSTGSQTNAKNNNINVLKRQNGLHVQSNSSVKSFDFIVEEIINDSPEYELIETNKSKNISSPLLERHNHKQLFQIVDLALNNICDDNEENLLQSLHSFIEVKNEFEKKEYSPTSQSLKTSHCSNEFKENYTEKSNLTNEHLLYRKQRRPSKVPSIIPENYSAQRHLAVQPHLLLSMISRSTVLIKIVQRQLVEVHYITKKEK